MTGPLRYMPRPCDATPASSRNGATPASGPCPFRLDAPPGEFTAERYEKLADTAGRPGAEVPVDGPMFACHHTSDGAPVACGGWLAVCGDDHLGVRMAMAEGRLPREATRRPAGGPALFESYDAMATQQAAGVYDQRRANAWRRLAGHGDDLLTQLVGPEQAAEIRRQAEQFEADLHIEQRGSAGPDTVRSLT